MVLTSAPARALVVALGVLASCAGPGLGGMRDTDHPLAGRLWDPHARAFVEREEMLRRAAHSDIVLLGETHDNPLHHRLQREVVNARVAAGARPAVVMEQFDIGQQAAMDEIAARGDDMSSLLRGWDRDQYRDLIATIAAAGLTIAAGNIERERLRPVVRDGYASLPAGTLERLAMEDSWDAGRDALLAGLIQKSHCDAITPPLRDGLVRAQRLRDATLADAALGRIGRGVVFIIGRGHARRDIGAPRYIETRRPGTRMLSIAFVEVGVDRTVPDAYEGDGLDGKPSYDLLWFTARAERPDPCAAFRR